MNGNATKAARKAWDGFTEDERAAVRFGMVPIEADQIAREIDPEITPRELSLALFDIAKETGGMVA